MMRRSSKAKHFFGKFLLFHVFSFSFPNYFVFFFANSLFLRTFAPNQAKFFEKLTFMLDRTQTIEKLKTTRQYLEIFRKLSLTLHRENRTQDNEYRI